MRAIRNFLLMILVLGGAAVAGYLYWDMAYRWRPHPITKDQDQIAKILDASGWVSPVPAGTTASGPKLYMIAYRGCEPCMNFERAEIPALRKAGVDARIIMIARPDINGLPKSTAGERSTVAELWVNRRWSLFQSWLAAPVDNWAAPDVPAADGDVARSAVVEAGRDAVDKLTPLISDNGLKFTYPTVIWWTSDGKMEGCACEDARSYHFVAKDLGAS